MVTVYGMTVCPSTMEALEELKKAKVAYTFKNFAEATQNLKDFLVYRDDPANKAIFDPVRAGKGIGIPFFVFEDGTVTDDIQMALKKGK